MKFFRNLDNRKLNLIILSLILLSALQFLDHFLIHGYWFDVPDLLLKTDSGLGFDSHEFFAMLFAFLAIITFGIKKINLFYIN